MTVLNRVLWWFGVMLVPCPPSAKMLHEVANVYETGRNGGLTVKWLRQVARWTR